MVREADQYASADKERRAAIEAKNEAETLIYSAEKNVNEYKDKVCLSFDWCPCSALSVLKGVFACEYAHAGGREGVEGKGGGGKAVCVSTCAGKSVRENPLHEQVWLIHGSRLNALMAQYRGTPRQRD